MRYYTCATYACTTIRCAVRMYNMMHCTYRIAGNFGEVLIWRIGDFTENRQI